MYSNISFNYTPSVELNNNSKTEKKEVKPVKKDTQDSVDLTKNNKSKKKNIISGVIAGLAVAAAIGISVYKHKNILKEIPNELKPLFKDLKHKNGKEFVDDAYKGLVKHMGLDDVAPKCVNLTEKADGIFGNIKGGFNPVENTIDYTKGFIDKLTKKQQFNLLSHELKHCKQFNTILRTEGLGAEAIANAQSELIIWGNGLFGCYGDEIMKKYPKKEAEQIIKEYKNSLVKELKEKINTNFANTLKMPKIPVQSEEGIKAKKYLEAYKNYKGTGILGIGSKEYKNNLLEVEAYAFGDKMGKWYKALSSPIDSLKEIIRVLNNNKN